MWSKEDSHTVMNPAAKLLGIHACVGVSHSFTWIWDCLHVYVQLNSNCAPYVYTHVHTCVHAGWATPFGQQVGQKVLPSCLHTCGLMLVHTQVLAHTCMCSCICLHAHAYAPASRCMHVYACIMHGHMHPCTCTHVQVHIHMHVHVHMHSASLSMCTCTYMCVHMYMCPPAHAQGCVHTWRPIIVLLPFLHAKRAMHIIDLMCVHTLAHSCMHALACMCMCTHMHVHTCSASLSVCTCMCMHLHIHACMCAWACQ